MKGRAAILEGHRARTAAIAFNAANRGVFIAMVLAAPFAACLPVD